MLITQRKPKRLHKRKLNERCDIEKVMKEGVRMSKVGAKFSEVRELLMKDEDFKVEYNKLKPQYDVISQIIYARVVRSVIRRPL